MPSGDDNMKDCPKCYGAGHTYPRGIMWSSQTCLVCHGSGRIPKSLGDKAAVDTAKARKR